MKLLLPLLTAGLALGLVIHDPFQDATAETQPVAGSVHMLTGRGGNIGLSIGDDGVLMVDDQFAAMEAKIREAIGKLSDEKPSYIINTHWHGDHTGGNAAFARDGVLVAHDNVRGRLKEGGRGSGPAPAEALPALTFNREMSVYFNGEQVQLIHLPGGHTDGDSIVVFHDSKVVHMGDLFFSGMFPFIDTGSGGSLAGYAKNVDFVMDLIPADWPIIPGHGPLSNREDLVAFQEMIEQTSAYVQAGIDAGKTRDEVIAAGLPSEWDSWSWNFITTSTWVATLYDGLEGR